MKRLISLGIFIFLMLTVFGVLRSLTDSFTTFRIRELAQNADDIMTAIKGWFK